MPFAAKNRKNHDDWICSRELYWVGRQLIKSRRCIEISAASFATARHVYCPASEHGGGGQQKTATLIQLLVPENLYLLSLIAIFVPKTRLPCLCVLQK